MLDLQTILVFLIVAAAAVYVGRRVWRRIAAFGSSDGGSCETGCGKCASASNLKSTAKVERGRL